MAHDCLFCRKIAALDELPPDEVVWQFPHSVAFLGPWQIYHGYCVLASRLHATELSQLNDEDRLYFLDEMCMIAKAIEDCFRPKKLNYEMLGNQTPHLHWHVFPRYAHDSDPLHPVWMALERGKDNRAARHRLKEGPMPRADIAAQLRERLTTISRPST